MFINIDGVKREWEKDSWKEGVASDFSVNIYEVVLIVLCQGRRTNTEI